MAALGISQLAVEVPGGTGVELVEMAVWMTVPMVPWMRFRGHAWRPCAEMALAMLLRRDEYTGHDHHRGVGMI